MKYIRKKLYAALALTAIVTGSLSASGQARLQVIHNAADPAADSVDVYLNGSLLLDDFKFRTATPYVTVPAGVTLNIGIAPGTSATANDTLKNFEVTLANGGVYLAVANGVLNPASFAANPDGRPTAFTLFLQDQMQETAGSGTTVDFRALHGASDAPAVDVIARGVATLVNDASYGDITGYLSVPPASYILDVTPAAGSPILVSYTADLSMLGGGSAVVFASGFLDPSANQNGPGFGLYAALANGTVVPFGILTGLKQLTGEERIGVYPNPARGSVRITSPVYLEEATATMVNPMGQVVRTFAFRGKEANVSLESLSPGLYSVHIQGPAGYSVSKLVVE